MRLIVRPMPGFKSVATSVHVSVGSRDEEADEWGLSHFVEHMLFKGTTKRSAEDIAKILSSLGVEYNAYTSNVATCYHTKGLLTNVDDCCDVLSDMFFNLKFSDEEFKRECGVIVQEIIMHDDNPRHALSDLTSGTYFADTAFGHPIAGTVKSVKSFRPADIHNYIKKHYTAPNTIISFTGDITIAQAEAMVQKYFLPHFKGTKAKPNIRPIASNPIAPIATVAKRKKKIEQHNAAMLFPAVQLDHADRFALTYVCEILSIGMSSRLFTAVREKLGLVYSISGGVRVNDLGGYLYVWFSCTPKNTGVVFDTIRSEITRLVSDGVTDEEMQKVKNIKRSSKMFASEDVEQISYKNATQLSTLGKIETDAEYLKNLEAVTPKQVNEVAKKYLDLDKATICVVGPNIKI